MKSSKIAPFLTPDFREEVPVQSDPESTMIFGTTGPAVFELISILRPPTATQGVKHGNLLVTKSLWQKINLI